MKKFFNLLSILVLYSANSLTQEFDLIFTGTESGTQTHIARNSVVLGPGYTYTPGGGTMNIEIQNPVVTGTIAYNDSPVDPQTRSLNTTYMVGATNGSLSVNALGGATYMIPIEVPHGLSGLAPNLSLIYSSNSGSGIAGYGWNISGLSVISRGPKTFYHDGIAKGVNLDTTDRFYIDGQRLVITNTYAYGNALAEYQTDNDIFTRVKQYGTDSYGPKYFKAETKAGIIFEYGNSNGSKQRITGFEQTINWYVSRVTDLFGNQISISYLQDNYNVYPAEITYGPNTITFYYKERSDFTSSYFKGTRLQQRLILEKITVKYNSDIIKTYELKYNSSGAISVNSLLNEVIEYGIANSRVNSTAFTYYSPDGVSFQIAAENTGDVYISNSSRVFPGDYNGDGRTDIFCLPSSGGFRCYLSGFNNTFYVSDYGEFNIDETGIQVLDALDLNGDNADDVIFSIKEKYYYAISNQGDFGECIHFASGGNWVAYKYLKRNSGDIDGDGLDDFLILSTSGEIRIYSFAFINGQLSLMAMRNTLNLGTTVTPGEKIYLLDFDGDGKADLWKISNSGLKIYTFHNSSVFEINSSASPTTGHFYSFGDFNGDWKADVLEYGSSFDYYNWHMKHSTGTSFQNFDIPQLKANLKNDVVRVGDFNGDGCSDLSVTANNDSWSGNYFYMAKNQGTELYTYFYPGGPNSTWRYYPGDFNGDGRYDFLCTWNIGYKVHNSPGRRSCQLEKVGNGLGAYARLTYFQLSEVASALYQRGTGASFPVIDFQGPVSVVDLIQYDNGKGSLNYQFHYYKGMKIHRQGKGVIGFSNIQVYDAANNILSESTYDYDPVYFYPRLINSTKKITGAPTSIENKTYIWTHKVLNSVRKRIFPYIQSTAQTNILTGHSVTITCDYDNYGNPTAITKVYSNGTSTTETHEYNNTVTSTKWLLGRPVLSISEYTGDNSTLTRACARVFSSNNNMLTRETWHSGTTLAVQNSYEYNTNGTLKKQTVKDIYRNVSRSVEYTYESGNGIRVATIKDPLLHITTNTYDSYGRLHTQSDYLSNQVTYSYDNLHRQVSISKSDGSGASVIYAWENPTSAPLLARYSIKTDGLDGAQTKVWYDKLGREIRSDVKGFDGTMVHTDTEYNVKGQVYRVSEPYNSGSALWNTFTYDNYGRKTGLTTPSGANSTWQYMGNTVTETTAGKTFTKTYSADGTLTNASDEGGTISYFYYPDGMLSSIMAPGGIITSMEYDIAGNQIKLVDPSAGETEYGYNGFGDLISIKNARNQTTTLTYLSDGRLQKKVAAEGISTYSYNTNKQLTNISSPGSISRSYGYDTKGRISTITENIPGSASFISTFTYDNKGRLFEVTHPSGITERYGYNGFGYFSSFGSGSTPLYTTLNVNARGQVTRCRLGNNMEVYPSYNNFGFLTGTMALPTGTSTPVQTYYYDFNSVTGNLNYRMRSFQGSSIQENFEYDNLNRLHRVYNGSTTLLDMAYHENSGGITAKSDIGMMHYEFEDKPYALSAINPSTGLIPELPVSVTYTSFESVNSIWEGTYKALFTYNSDNERAKMTVQQNANDILTRWYPNSRYIKETAGGVTKEYTFLGGDAYTAPVVAVKQGSATTYYYLLRDHLGSITHVVNASNCSLAAEYSYDAWGRMRDVSSWNNYAPGSEPVLMIAGRGYSGHEHLPWFNLINMNGRVYDPLTGQFLSPDNFVQDPLYSQSYNRYTYCLNNPLKYTDPSGEWWQWLLGGIAGGVYNVIANWDDINGDFVKFNQYAFVGVVAGSTAAWLADQGVAAPGIGMATGWIMNSGNAFIRGARGGDFIQAGGEGALAGGAVGFAMMGIGPAFNKLMDIPWATNYPGVPGNVKEVTLGDWLFGSRSSSINNIISTQGTSLSTSIFVNSIPSINLGALARPSPRPMYMNSYLDFSGTLTNYTGGGQYANGTMDWFDNYSDGSTINRGSWVAVSGPWGNPIARGTHTIRNGYMGLNTGIPGYIRDGTDFYIDLFPDPSYEIHPDGNVFGTLGCIGIQESGVRSLDLYNRIRTYVRRYNVLQLYVNY